MKDGIELIVGLGNPGRQYEDTRHNAGAWFVERLARQHNANLSNDPKYNALTGRATINGHDVRFLIPTTYMNVSGQAVAPFANFYKIPPDRILVAHDELDLLPGVAKLKQGGGHGGHNGLRDIISKLGNNKNFARLRIGIGHPGSADQVSSFVLGKAPAKEQQLIDDAIDEALGVMPDLLGGNANKAMNRLHSFAASS
ncbi:MAG: aminoacyl-tRNA hydrolase [Pseudomonadales bacterium]|nr:aminoacyl-tRNA hydrolase [Pseudomonadales bacterium]RLU03405.1 MAG: aminoacyl-tRNA hydrolase [Ketobacter sp.]